MEVLIFGLVSAIMLALFVALSLMPAYLAYWIGTRTRIYLLRWVFSGIVLGLPLAWAGAGYVAFKQECAAMAGPVFLLSPAIKPDGIAIDVRHMVAEDLLKRGEFKFVEFPEGASAGRVHFADHVESASRATVTTDFIAAELPPEPVAYWWAPPIYRHAIQVTEKSTGRVFAKASDLVFGGGLLSWYMRVIGGDQDYRYLSCGYAAADIGPWRPSLSDRPRYKQYRDADVKFLARAVSPTDQPTPAAENAPTK